MGMPVKFAGLLICSVSALALAGGGLVLSQRAAAAPGAQPLPPGAERSTLPNGVYRAAGPPQTRRAFFGELHLHTAMSLDAWAFGTRLMPDTAYKFARGQTVMVPAEQVAIEQGLHTKEDVPARRSWPLDFAAVTDHSEYLGAMPQLGDPASAFSKSATGQQLTAAGRAGFGMVEQMSRTPGSAANNDLKAAAATANGWAAEMKAADDNYQPGKFTTFVAYEWTATAGYGTHMHRNVIFNADHGPTPFTAVQSDHPEDLWKYLESVRRQGIDVIAIPHNANLSDGHDFDWNMSDGRPIDEAYALERALNEPLVEIAQTKGDSETTPQLSPEDEFANFEIMDRVYKNEATPNQHGSYVREAWGRGLVIQSKVGANPFKMGVTGGSDIHNGLTASDENAYAGRISGLDPKTMLPTGAAAEAALGMNEKSPGVRANGQRENDPLQFSSPGITGVWAEENTRNSIFAALKRKETFATSGTRLRLRMFGGWNYRPHMLHKTGWVAQAYAQGVPMGSDLPAKPSTAAAPRFVLEAMKDPDGANLDRVEMIKVWLDHGSYRERVYDVALSGGLRDDAKGRAPPVGDTVDLKTGKYTNTIGTASLAGVWRDPDFDPKVPAVYYARALEIPTPRWTTLLAIRNGLPIPKRGPATLQERAWSSPIWFTPAGFRPAS
jgi:hypothetical protein